MFLIILIYVNIISEKRGVAQPTNEAQIDKPLDISGSAETRCSGIFRTALNFYLHIVWTKDNVTTHPEPNKQHCYTGKISQNVPHGVIKSSKQ